LFPQNRFFHIPTLIEAAPGVHPVKARWIAANVAKLPELLRKACGHGASRKTIAPAQSMHAIRKPVNM